MDASSTELSQEDREFIEFLHGVPRKAAVPLGVLVGLGFLAGFKRGVAGEISRDAYRSAAKAFALGTFAAGGSAFVAIRSTMYVLDVKNTQEFGDRMKDLFPKRKKTFGPAVPPNSKEPELWEWRFWLPPKDKDNAS